MTFFAEKRVLRGQKKALTKQTIISAKAHKPSCEVAYLIAQTKKLHMIGETLTKPAAIASQIMHVELEQVLLSGTVSRRISRNLSTLGIIKQRPSITLSFFLHT